MPVDQKVLNSFNMKDSLHPKFWDTDLNLDPKARKRLLEIAKDLFESLELKSEIKIRDVRLTGSIANFNWSKFSDVDLHVVIEFDDVLNNKGASEEFVRPYMMLKKSQWNEAHDIDMFGFPVEVYVEDQDDAHVASGLFSVLKNKWITVPKKQKPMIDKDDIRVKAEGFTHHLQYLSKKMKEKSYDAVIKGVDKLNEKIRNMRQSGLEKGGEFSTENLAFKVLRRSSFIDKLGTLKKQAFDAKMTLENKHA